MSSIKPLIAFVLTIAVVGLLYYVFDIMLYDYFFADASMSSVLSTTWYSIFTMAWKFIIIIILLLEIVWLFMSSQEASY